jgi:NAD(P)-dependent dehydrogenase (short-subunit alcohol dehydrogenase family)
MDVRLDGKVAVVTGGSKGIGLGIAEQLALSGASVMITSRKAEGCEAAAEQIRAAGGECSWRAGNAGKVDDAEAVLAATMTEYGAIDILVNNAATNPSAGRTIDSELWAWDKTFEVNVRGPFVWTQLAYRKHMEANGGVVLNISSVGGMGTSPLIGLYDVTKAALIHLTKQLGAELGPGVRVNALCPGLVKTDFARALWEGPGGEHVAKRMPMRRLGEPSDIATAATFLCSDAAAWLTGQTLVVDGGQLVAFPIV